MNETTEAAEAANPYRAPEASLAQPVSADGRDILKFTRFSAWGVFGLTIITLGVYLYYWMYSRSKTINSVHESKIPLSLPLSLFVFMILSYIITPSEDPAILLAYGAMSLSGSILYLVVLFKIRNRLQTIINQSSYTKDTLGVIFTLFFHVIYLQYKINECIDLVKISDSDPIHSST